MAQLLEIRSDAQRVAEAIASALQLEVTIVDRKYNLVANSRRFGRYYDYTKKELYPSFWKKMFNTKRTLIVKQPGKHPFCTGCRLEGKCPEKALVLTPIWFADDIVGSIGVTCFTEEQRENILKRNEILADFLSRMSEFLTVKLSEVLTQKKLLLSLRQLETTMDYAKEGLICIDKKGIITHINSVAMQVLKHHREVLNQPINDVLSNFPLDEILVEKKAYEEHELVIQRGEKSVNLLVSAKPILMEDTVQSIVISIRDMSDVHALIYKMTGSYQRYTFDDIIGESQELVDVKHRARIASNSDSTILIQGETGTGKELFARAIHNHSLRKKKPFIPINCAAIPETLLESELFGYEDGAFTGAKKGGKPGKFEIAKGGTVFLDEIGDMPLHLQAKLLRVLQEKEIQRLGGTRTIPVDVRIIAATNKNLEKMVARGEFREDLYYRINVIPLIIPPLRDRRGDILPLINYFIRKYNNLLNKEVKGITEEALKILCDYTWPGNIRELENCIEYAINMESEEKIQKANLPERILKSAQSTHSDDIDKETPKMAKKLNSLEERVIIETLKKYTGMPRSVEKAAKELGISRATMYRKLKKIRERN